MNMMKAGSNNKFTLFRRIFLVAAMVAAYLLGKSQGVVTVQNAESKSLEAKKTVPGTIGSHLPANANVKATADDIQKMLAELASLPPGPKALAAYRSAFEHLAMQNAANGPIAAAAALALPDGPDRIAALRGVAAGWAISNPQADLAWASQLPASDGDVLKEALIDAGRSQPALAAQYLDKLTDASGRNSVISSLAEAMAQNDPSAALGFIDKVATGVTYDNALQNIFSNLAQHDPLSGVAALANLSDQRDRNAVITELAKSWSSTDPVAAFKWVESLPDSDGIARDAALTASIGSLSKNDLASTLALVKNSNDPALLAKTAPTLAQAMAKYDVPGAMAWVDGLPNGTSKDQAESTVLVALAQSDFPAAWKNATNLPSGSGRDGAMESIVTTLAKNDPAQAASLLNEFGSEAASLSATATVAANWAKEDPRALSEWVNTLPTGDQRDTAVVQMVSVQAGTDPATALAWANSIGDSRTRTAQLLSVVRKWGNTDPAAAANAVQSLNLPDNMRNNFMIELVKTKGSSK